MNINDKRFIKNETLIRDTFLNLLKEKHYLDISVAELCRSALISKNTFYYHYENLDSLLKKIMNEEIKKITRISEESTMNKNYSEEVAAETLLATFDCVNDDFNVFYPLFLRDDEINFLNRLVAAVEEQTFREHRINRKEDAGIILLTDYTVFGSLRFIKGWVLSKDSISTEEARRLLSENLKIFLQQTHKLLVK